MLKVPTFAIGDWIDNYEFNKGKPVSKQTSAKITRSTRTLPDKERKEIIKFVTILKWKG